MERIFAEPVTFNKQTVLLKCILFVMNVLLEYFNIDVKIPLSVLKNHFDIID